MARKHDVTQIHLSVDSWNPFVNDEYEGIYIQWRSDIGFGEYTIYRTKGSNCWFADSEYMDSDTDKAFVSELLKLIIKDILIAG